MVANTEFSLAAPIPEFITPRVAATLTSGLPLDVNSDDEVECLQPHLHTVSIIMAIPFLSFRDRISFNGSVQVWEWASMLDIQCRMLCMFTIK